MPTDLKAHKDHPVNLLYEAMKSWDYVPHSGPGIVLRQYETAHSVTFAALDNDALTHVREMYEAGPAYYEEFALAVRDLLGLDD